MTSLSAAAAAADATDGRFILACRIHYRMFDMNKMITRSSVINHLLKSRKNAIQKII